MIIALLEVINGDMEEIKTFGSGHPDVILHPLLDMIVLDAMLLSLLRENGVVEFFMKCAMPHLLGLDDGGTM